MKCRKNLENYVTKHRAAFQSSSSPRLVLSHVPLHETVAPGPLKRLVLQLEPSYIFSGHIHHESYSTHVVQKSGKEGRLVHEITVPTCSYRMGEQYMGVGVAVIGKACETVSFEVIIFCSSSPLFSNHIIVSISYRNWYVASFWNARHRAQHKTM